MVTLSQRLFLFSVIGLLPVFAVVGLLEVQLRQAREAEVRDIVTRQSQQAASEMERLVEGVRTLLTAVTLARVVQRFEPESCSAYMAALVRRLPQLGGLIVLDTAGNPRCTDADRPIHNYADREYFRKAVETRDFVVGHYTAGRAEPNARVLPFAMPLLADDGTVTGVVATALKLSAVQAIIEDWGLPPGGSLTIADGNGTIIARNPLPDRFVGTSIPSPYLEDWVKASEPGVAEVLSQDGTLRILAYKPARLTPAGIYVSTGVAHDEVFAAVDRNWIWNVGVLVAGLLGALATSWITTRIFVGRPVQDLVALAGAWSKGETGRDRKPFPTREFESIAAALDAMGHDIEERSSVAARRQELLVSELNHRVKNTLALVQAIGTQTATHARDPDEFNASFGERIRSLARTHDLLTTAHWTGVDLRALVEAEIAATAAPGRVEIDGPTVEIPAGLAVSISLIVHELATNAVKYGCLAGPGGRLTVDWSLETGDGGETLGFRWRERCALPVSPPVSTGFGTRLIKRTLASIGSGSSDFTPDGLAFAMTVPLDPFRKTGD